MKLIVVTVNVNASFSLNKIVKIYIKLTCCPGYVAPITKFRN